MAGGVLLAGCGGGLSTLDHPGRLAAIKARGELVILTRNAPTVSYFDRDDQLTGPEHDLAAAFAKHLGVKPHFVELDSVQAMLDALAKGEADLAAGSITRTRAREKHFDFGPEYARVWQEVVCNNDNTPRNLADLAEVKKLVVAAGTSYVARLAILKREHPKLGLHWSTTSDYSTGQLFAKVAEHRIDCTIADSNVVAINRRYHPKLLVMFKISPAQHLAWPLPQGATKLRHAASQWFGEYKKSGKFKALQQRYYGFIRKWDYVDTNTLVRRTKKVFPKYDALFTDAAKKYDFDKWLLAAQAYQESHWNPQATSNTGVQGMMMLTLPTARALGVTNRLNPEQSVMGGAQYLRKMEQKLPASIKAPDRYYFALAAYNIGYAHLRDAMTLAQRLGNDPLTWAGLRKTLPLLTQKRYYQHLKRGYARGIETVRYIQRIRDYSDVIRRIATRKQH